MGSEKGMMERELKISKIEEGTVIDHIEPGKALDMLVALHLREEYPNSVILMVTNVAGKSGLKDILKIEGKRLTKRDLRIVHAISHNATINIIKDFEVVKKAHVSGMVGEE